ncbi:MAG: DUF3078 domain-containing protein [Muribaculaceae bacterium]|nr:DUF3078 domain-containing protein [Muribaculaceae bacterium]
MHLHKALLLLAVALGAASANAQYHYRGSARMADSDGLENTSPGDSVAAEFEFFALDSLAEPVVSLEPLPAYFFMPAVYTYYDFPDTVSITAVDYSGDPALRWLEDANAVGTRMQRMRHRYFFAHPEAMPYIAAEMPDAPKRYSAVVDPATFSVDIIETVEGPAEVPTIKAEEVKKRHWIRTSNVSLQFSQAYVSPNWYQGGNNNLNMLGQAYYNVKLNPEFHKNILFETTAQYKLGMMNAPDDEYHDYNINDDLLQINSTFGLKAARRWYYSVMAQFKTQLLNSYKSNTMDLKSGFLSPGDLTVGLGMTYNYANEPKTFTFDASISPLSYNLRTCITDRIPHENYGIEQNRKTVHKFGSNAELKVYWKICYNIYLRSRVYGFTDYESIQADWENTIVFEINKFLTTQLFVHARYDTRTPAVENSDWRKFQFKEILSIGFAYKFSSI